MQVASPEYLYYLQKRVYAEAFRDAANQAYSLEQQGLPASQSLNTIALNAAREADKLQAALPETTA